MDKVSGFNGKGSGSRVADKKAFDDNWDRIFGKKKKDTPDPCNEEYWGRDAVKQGVIRRER
jgi:hypothetical protein